MNNNDIHGVDSYGLFDRAKEVIPGGVNSPVRSFKAIDEAPVFIESAEGARIHSESGAGFIDYCMSWGALILGHAHPEVIHQIKKAAESGTSFGAATRKEVEFAELIRHAVPSIEQVRLTSSGTEAAMSAIRLARGFTGRDKIIKFQGAYHGHADHLLGQAGSGAATLGIPDCAGVPADFVKHTIVLPYNEIDSVRETISKHGEKLAAIIVEPVAGNSGVIPPAPGFLEGLRAAADECGALLIFDEVITGFRVTFGGAQEYFRVRPDITCLGKIIGGGMPIGAFGGKRNIMQKMAPVGNVYQAGTLSGNPISVTAGITMLKLLESIPSYLRLEEETRRLCDGFAASARKHGVKLTINRVGSMFSLFFIDDEVTSFACAQKQDTEKFARFYREMLRSGVYLSPSGFETNFLSAAHSEHDIDATIAAANKAFQSLAAGTI